MAIEPGQRLSTPDGRRATVIAVEGDQVQIEIDAWQPEGGEIEEGAAWEGDVTNLLCCWTAE